jgi:succinate-semialdehyde dehydrogenase/glutarate-semialdehyde dehydrogenase/aspartate-semialdehyde dehydrogenase
MFLFNGLTATEPSVTLPKIPTEINAAAMPTHVALSETLAPPKAAEVIAALEHPIERANRSDMALAAYIYTTDLSRAMRLTERLEYGMVTVNTRSFTGAPIPLGSRKQSGLGREGSRHGLSEFMELKYIWFGDLS